MVRKPKQGESQRATLTRTRRCVKPKASSNRSCLLATQATAAPVGHVIPVSDFMRFTAQGVFWPSLRLTNEA
jgi:hypothetical protein